MYKEHHEFEQPESDSTKIWRYMNFTKLLSMIDKNCLFFVRADLLIDRFEGSLPLATISKRDKLPNNYTQLPNENIFLSEYDQREKGERARRSMAINCWHINKYESAAMWNMYLNGNEGVAIQSTVGRLKRSLAVEEDVYIGKIKYIDYNQDEIIGNSVFSPFLHKRRSFSFESELRAIIFRSMEDGSWKGIGEPIVIRNGIYVAIDVNELVEHIFIAPEAPSWFEELVKSVLKKYGFDRVVNRSEMSGTPLY